MYKKIYKEMLEVAKPILFNTDMVRAILRKPPNNKTVTRRVIRGYIPNNAIFGYTIFTPEGHISCRGIFADGYGEKFFKLPCRKDDILYVRETWSVNTECKEFYYKANRPNGEGAPYGLKWRPSIHMPKEAARIFLRVTDVRVERLRDITEQQAEKEGLYKGWHWTKTSSWASTAKQAFMWVWDRTIKTNQISLYGWIANPWVWVIEFERCR